jgi:hypothetical protein
MIIGVRAAMSRRIPVSGQFGDTRAFFITDIFREEVVGATIDSYACPRAIALHTVQARNTGTAGRRADNLQLWTNGRISRAKISVVVLRVRAALLTRFPIAN